MITLMMEGSMVRKPKALKQATDTKPDPAFQDLYIPRKEGDSTGLCIYDFPRKSGQPCSFHEDCSGYGPGTTQMACCDGTCKKKSKKHFMDLFGSCP